MKTSEIVHVGSRYHVESHLILLVKAETNYSMIYMVDGSSFLVSTTLKIIQGRLENNESFKRVHRSFLANTDYLKECKNGFLFFENNFKCLISRRKLKAHFPELIPTNKN